MLITFCSGPLPLPGLLQSSSPSDYRPQSSTLVAPKAAPLSVRRGCSANLWLVGLFHGPASFSPTWMSNFPNLKSLSSRAAKKLKVHQQHFHLTADPLASTRAAACQPLQHGTRRSAWDDDTMVVIFHGLPQASGVERQPSRSKLMSSDRSRVPGADPRTMATLL